MIVDLTRFAAEVCPRYFAHRNFASFVRQLSAYGFLSTRAHDKCEAYRHKYDKFRRDRHDLLPLVTRRKDKRAPQSRNRQRQPDHVEQIAQLTATVVQLQQQIVSLSQIQMLVAATSETLIHPSVQQ